jgi:hypothetical protein
MKKKEINLMKNMNILRSGIMLFLCFSVSVFSQEEFLLSPISGADGVFESVQMSGKTVYRSIFHDGHYDNYMYFQCNREVRNRTVYLQVQYLDIGFGYIRLDYNSTMSHYDFSATGYQNYVQDSKQVRTAVFELRQADFTNAQNLGADLRLATDGSIQMHIIEAHIYLEPTLLFLQYNEDWLTPYSGPEYTGEHLVDATTLTGKVICGYQGWFRTAGDPSGAGWVHYVAGNFNDVTVEMWPDLLEYNHEEKYPVPGWTFTDGKQSYLFSSANKASVLRHFQWMETYGIDGVAVQRFGAGLSKQHDKESFRIAGYAREAANRTGRVYYIMYDISGMNPSQIVDILSDDWHYLVDTMKITKDDRYLYHAGKPVVGLFGFFTDRFTANVANQLLDSFQNAGPYQAFVMGSGQWPWRNDAAPGWLDVFKRMDAYCPWNIGNYNGDYASTATWAGDKSVLDAAGAIFMPLVYPGFCWDNLKNLAPGTSYQSRLKGKFLWRQFTDAKKLGAQTVYVAMFDEIDEGTAIFKVTNDPPVNHYFVGYEGLPSDFYLLLTGYGTKIIRGELPVPGSMPDFAAQSQPSIPEIISPAYGDSVYNDVVISWIPAKHTSGIQNYELEVDQGHVIQLADTFRVSAFSNGNHSVRVRAFNGLLNPGGWSETISFIVTDKPLPAVTFSVSIPSNTTVTDQIYIAGNFNFWDPGPAQAGTDGLQHDLLMQKTGDHQWQISLTFTIGQMLEYKYTRGSWTSVETGAAGEAIANRTLGVPNTDFMVNDIVASWTDIGTHAADGDKVKPVTFQLEQNYPNPFNAATVICYSLPQPEHVRLSLINLKGETVKKLVDQVQDAGSHQTTLISDLPSGIYFYTIVAGQDVASKKLLLVR